MLIVWSFVNPLPTAKHHFVSGSLVITRSTIGRISNLGTSPIARHVPITLPSAKYYPQISPTLAIRAAPIHPEPFSPEVSLAQKLSTNSLYAVAQDQPELLSASTVRSQSSSG